MLKFLQSIFKKNFYVIKDIKRNMYLSNNPYGWNKDFWCAHWFKKRKAEKEIFNLIGRDYEIIAVDDLIKI